MSTGENRDSKPLRVLIADDHSLYRTGLAFLLRDQLNVEEVIEANDFDNALDQLAACPDLDLALFDLSMPGMGGPESLGVVTETYPGVRVAVVSASEEREHVARAIALGLAGYIPKSLTEDEIARALSRIIGGDVFVPRLATVTQARRGAAGSRAIDPENGSGAEPPAGLSRLTPRQRDVLNGIVRGLSNKEIARELGIARGTVKIHLAALFAHFEARNRTDLATRATALLR